VRAAAFLVLAALSIPAAEIPGTLVSEDEAEPIHSAIVRREAWTQEPVRHLRIEAEKRMKEGPWTVTADRPRGLDIDPHEYYSEAPFYWPDPITPDGPYVFREGRINPDRFIANRNALNSMCDAVLTLGAAGFFLDDAHYAQRAERLINTWFLNPKTRMNPSLEFAQGVPGVNSGRPAGTIEGRAFIRAVQGMEFLAQTGAWDAKDQAAVRRWFEDYLRWLVHGKNGIEERKSGGNHASWWTAQTAAIASFVENGAEQQAVFDHYRRSVLPAQVRAGAGGPQLFNLESLSTTCRIAQVHGVDLWQAPVRPGVTIGTLIDEQLRYLDELRAVSKEQTIEPQSGGLYFLAFAGMGLKKPEYISLFEKLEHSDDAWRSLVELLIGRWEAAAHQTRH
jgi:Alginate lyase